jgi:hypothetical protein
MDMWVSGVGMSAAWNAAAGDAFTAAPTAPLRDAAATLSRASQFDGGGV